MTSDRIEEIIKQTAYPESNSVYQALLQVWNEIQQDCNEKIGSCGECKHAIIYSYQNTRCGSGSLMDDIQVEENWYCADFERK